MSMKNLLAILANNNSNANNTVTNETNAMINTENTSNTELRGLMLLTIPPIESLALLMVAAERIQAPKVTILGQGIIALSQEVFFSDTTPAHGEFKELIEKVLCRAGEIIKAPVTSMGGVDPQVVERRKFHVNDYMDRDARPKKALEWCSEIEDLTKKIVQTMDWTFTNAWKYIAKEERALLVWRQMDIHFMALAVYFQDYAAYSMNELTTGQIARIGVAPTAWDYREDTFEFGYEALNEYGRMQWYAYDKAECIKMWLAGTLDPEVLVRCSNATGFTQLSRYRDLPYWYKQYFRM